MRCMSCNELMNDYEATRRYRSTNEYLDLCRYCSSHVSEIEIDDRAELKCLIDEVELWHN